MTEPETYVRCLSGGCGTTHDGEPYLCPLHAAAGDLLSALESLLEVAHLRYDPDCSDVAEFQQAKAAAKSAIAKAKEKK